MKEIIAKQKELIKEWENLSIMNSCQRYIKGLERIDKLKSELTSLEAEQGTDLPLVEQSSQGGGSAEEWLKNKGIDTDQLVTYYVPDGLGDGVDIDMLELLEEYAQQKCYPEWIDINKEEPDSIESVICWGSIWRNSYIVQYVNGRFNFKEGSQGYHENITHWIPLPKAPTGKRE